MKHIKFLTLIFIVVILISNRAIFAESTQYQYGLYATQGSWQGNIVLFTPQEAKIAGTLALPLPEGMHQPLWFVPSPNGYWIAFPLAEKRADPRQLSMVRLFNVSNKQSIDLSVGNVILTMTGFTGKLQNLVWSPDSQYFAINIFKDSYYKILIYHIPTNRIMNVSDDENLFGVAWSNDSTQIVTTTERCNTPNLGCKTQLAIYDVLLQKQIKAISLSNFIPDFSYRSTATCQISWSPSNDYIAFASICNSTLFNVPMEVYVWNTSDNYIIRLTNYTDQTHKASKRLFGFYNLAWINNVTLIVGSVYYNAFESIRSEAFLYDVEHNQKTSFRESGITDITLNKSGRIAFRQLPSQISLNALRTNSYPVNLSSVDTKQSNLIQLTDGCAATWSPDGIYLAYLFQRICSDPIYQLVVVNILDNSTVESNIISQHHFTPIGWLAR